jgi:hypothetical protein
LKLSPTEKREEAYDHEVVWFSLSSSSQHLCLRRY